ncbi:MAG: hypothetical protein KBA86_01640 [Bacteroidales bacterium]|nr:hypothetical protein [Bacteroidales bacterium]
MKKIIVFIFLCISFQQIQAQDLDSSDRNDSDIYIIGLIRLENPILVFPKKRGKDRFECNAVCTEKKNLDCFVNIKKDFKYLIFDTNCYGIDWLPSFIYDCILPVSTLEIDTILRKTYHHPIVTPHLNSPVVDEIIFKYKHLRYRNIRINKFLLIKVKISLLHKYTPMDICYYLRGDKTMSEKYIKVLIPLSEW